MPSSSSPPRIKACIFDMDGLLLDTETIYSEVTNKILEPYGKVFPLETKIKMMGRDVRAATDILLSDLQIPLSFEEYNAKALALKEELFRKAEMMPGAERLIRHLASSGIPIAVATSSARPMFAIKTARHQSVFGLFNGNVTCGDDPAISNAKPAPDLFLTAMDRLDKALQPADCLVFEDATNGIEAANNARMSSVWVHDMRFALGGSAPKDSHGATERITSLVSFDPSKYGLPPFSS
ncbi:putative pseudouridine-5'-monophosphatase [Martensiomyces pterosporus]|nr:putative pseudouridine-5'-monophosphatase [Martensiomyces pterosporus]